MASLMAAFRDHIGRDQPTDDEIRATVDALLREAATEFLLAAPDGHDARRRRLPAALPAVRLDGRRRLLAGGPLRDRRGARHGPRPGADRRGAFERARARGCRRIQLDVAEDNERAIEVYSRAGFGTEPGAPGRTMLIARRL